MPRRPMHCQWRPSEVSLFLGKCGVYGALFRRKAAFVIFAMLKHRIFQSSFLSMWFSYPSGLAQEPAVFDYVWKRGAGLLDSPPPQLANAQTSSINFIQQYNNTLKFKLNFDFKRCRQFFTSSYKEKIAILQHHKYHPLQFARLLLPLFCAFCRTSNAPANQHRLFLHTVSRRSSQRRPASVTPRR